MVFRAKITRIFSFVEENFNLSKIRIVQDSRDAYIEVQNEELAEVLERLNDLEVERCKLSIDFYILMNKYYNSK